MAQDPYWRGKEMSSTTLETVGISPKAKLAAAIPTLLTLAGVLVQWVITGEYDKAELVTSIMGFLTAAGAFAGAWLGGPGQVVSK